MVVTLKAGMLVEARFKASTRFFPARVVRCNVDKTFCLSYDWGHGGGQIIEKVPRHHIQMPGASKDDFEITDFMFGMQIEKTKKKVNSALRGANKIHNLVASGYSLAPPDIEALASLSPRSSSSPRQHEPPYSTTTPERNPAALPTQAGEGKGAPALPRLTPSDEDAARRALRRVRASRKRMMLVDDARENGGPGYLEESTRNDESQSHVSGSAASRNDSGLLHVPTFANARCSAKPDGARTSRESCPTSARERNPGSGDMLSGAAQSRRAAIISAARAAVGASRLVEHSAAARKVGVNFTHFRPAYYARKRTEPHPSSLV